MSDSTAARLAAAMAATEFGLGPDGADDLLAFGKRMGVDFDSFGNDRSTSQIISHHNRALRDLIRDYGSHQGYVLTTSSSMDTKPLQDFARPPPFAALLPISCADLQLHTTHRRRVLKGKLVVDAMFMTGIHSVLQDEHGDVVQVKFYNIPELKHNSSGSFMSALRLAQQLFPKGQAVAIIEPYYKLASDGMRGVRVDNPAEVVFLDHLEETTEALQQKGDKCLAQLEYKEAVSCYTKALKMMQDDNQPASRSQNQSGQLLQSVLLNLSAAHLQLHHPTHALLFAAGAAAVSSHSNSKAYYRAAVALDQLLGDKQNPHDDNDGSSNSHADALCSTSSISSTAIDLMEIAVRLAGHTTASAKSQMMAALVNITRTATPSRPQGSKQSTNSSKDVAVSDVWRVVCQLLSSGMLELVDCFTTIQGSRGTELSGNEDASEAVDHCASGNASAVASYEKDSGNAAYKQGSYATALDHYLKALAALRRSNDDACMSTVLNSRATAWLKQPGNISQQQAFLDAITSALLAPHQPLGFITAASAALQLEDTAGAEAVCHMGLQLNSESSELQQLLTSVQVAAMAEQVAAVAEEAAKPQQHNAAQTDSSASTTADTCTASSSSSSSTGAGGRSSKRSNKHKGQKQRGQQARRTATASSSSSSHSGSLSEREVKEFIDSDAASVEQVAMMNEMISSAVRMGARAGRGSGGGAHGRLDGIAEMMLPNNGVPKLHEELFKAGRCPPQVDKDWAGRKLWEGYELGRAMPMHLMDLLAPEAVTPQLLLPRLGELTRERVRWMMEAPAGSVSFQRTFLPYAGGWQSFINCPARSEVLTPGTTHVAIGFVDLSGLAASCTFLAARNPAGTRTNAAAASSSSSSSKDSSGDSCQPLRWVGYEMSVPCVAKALVLLQMVQQGAAMDQVLQVWYSSAWSNSTVTAFRTAVTQLLTTAVTISQAPRDQQQSLHPSSDALTAPDVLTLLRHWQVKQVPLAAARQCWQHSMDHALSWITNFIRKQDRVALCELALTGELSALGPGDTGSVTMFAMPDAFGERAFDECFLQSLPFHMLVKAWTTACATTNIVAVGVDLLRQRTRVLIDMLRDGRVQAEVRVHLGALSLEAHDLIASIKSLQPYTISWSNVPDYMPPASFHKLAQAISAPCDTVHFMHSMNWVRAVKGACHLDLTMCISEEGLAKFIPELKQAGDSAISLLYRLLGLQHLLLCPAIDNPRNVVDYGLYTARYEAYVKAFFAPGLSGIRRPDYQVQVVEPPFYSIFSRTNSTIHITFSYDEDIHFQGISQP